MKYWIEWPWEALQEFLAAGVLLSRFYASDTGAQSFDLAGEEGFCSSVQSSTQREWYLSVYGSMKIHKGQMESKTIWAGRPIAYRNTIKNNRINPRIKNYLCGDSNINFVNNKNRRERMTHKFPGSAGAMNYQVGHVSNNIR